MTDVSGVGELLRVHDWGATPLGARAGWPECLRTAVELMMASGHAMCLAWGPERTFLYNDAYAPMLGARHPAAFGSTFQGVWSEIWAEIEPLVARTFEGETSTFQDMPLVMTRNGYPEDTWWTFSYSPVRDGEGAVAGLLNVTLETTARRLAERERDAAVAELRESEARFRLMADAVPQIVWITDADGRVEFFNRQWSDYTGVPYEPTTAADVAANHVHPDDGPATMSAFDEARASGRPFVVEHRIRSRAGEHRWFLVRADPYRDPVTGEIVRWFGASVDIHDRKLAEEGLRELNDTLEERVAARTAERNMLATMVETTDVLILAADLDYNILAINGANADEFERIYGVRPKVGDNMLALLADQPESREQVRAGWGRGLAGERVTFVEEYGDHARDRPYYEIKFRPIHDEAGTRIGAYQFVTDVSERLHKEAELATAQEALRQSQKMEAVGQLTGGVAHDFNNLLTIIRSSIDFLRRPDLPAERRDRYLNAASETVDRAAKLTGQLLAFARRQALKPETFDVVARIAAIADMLDTVTGARVRVVTDLPADACHVRADVSQFETALVNMAVNARDAMEGEGVLTLAVASHAALPAIRGHGGSAAAFTAIRVSDTGAGIPAGALSRIFEPFYTTKEVGKGTGLGLSQVFGFAKQSGGDIDVASVEGEGASFTLYLPEVAGGVSEPVAGGDGAEAPGGGGQHVLVVEDNLDVGRFCAQILEDLGYRATLVTNAEEALERLGEKGEGIDAVFSDVVMPGIGGLALARTLRERMPAMPVVLSSGYSHVLSQENEHGFELLHKPYSAKQVADTLFRVLR